MTLRRFIHIKSIIVLNYRAIFQLCSYSFKDPNGKHNKLMIDTILFYLDFLS